MHPHLKESRSGHASKLKRLSGAHGTEGNPAGNRALPYEMADGPQKNTGLNIEGMKPKKNLGTFARGGRTKGKSGAHVTVVVAPQGGGAAPPPMPMPGPMAGAPPAMAPHPMPMPPPGGAPGLPPGLPPGMMPPHKSGGRAFKRGGKVYDAGAASGEGRQEKSAAIRKRVHAKPKM